VDEALPDHICIETGQATVSKWIRSQWDDLSNAFYSVEEEGRFTGDHHNVNVNRDEVWDAARAMILESVGTWPRPYRHGWLGFVIQEWAQEEPSETLAYQLVDYQNWQRLVDDFRSFFHQWVHEYAYRNGANLISRVSPPGAMPKEDTKQWFEHWRQPAIEPWVAMSRWTPPWDRDGAVDADADQQLGTVLKEKYLPNTPQTMRHLKAVAAGQREPFPTRGLLVTTLVFVRPPIDDNLAIYLAPDHEVLIEGTHEFSVETLYIMAQEIAHKHRNWLHRFRQHPITTRSAIQRAQPASFRHRQEDRTSEYYDYLAEALRGVDGLRLLVKTHVNGREGAISKHLNDVYRRVHKRRLRDQLPLEPPAKWRERARQELRKLLA